MLELPCSVAGRHVCDRRRGRRAGRSGDVVVLSGEMGRRQDRVREGVRGGPGGVTEPITSPTFTLVHTYDTLPGSPRGDSLHHADLYRLDRTAEIADLLAGARRRPGVVLVEWGDVAEQFLGDHLSVPARAGRRTTSDLDPTGTVDDVDVFGLDTTRLIDRSRRAGRAWAPRWARSSSRPWERTDADLGIETATERVSVAVGGHEGVIGLFEVTKGRRHAETLVPAIEFTLRQADIELDEISVVAVDVGPGLFTGMRVGLASAKSIAQALRIPMIGISVARPARVHRAAMPTVIVVPVIDARKGEVFYAMYRRSPAGCNGGRPRSVDVDDLVADSDGAERGGALLSATARRRYREEILDGLPLRDRWRRPPSVGSDPRAARPCQGDARGLGAAPRHRAGLPARTRRRDQLVDPGDPMSVDRAPPPSRCRRRRRLIGETGRSSRCSDATCERGVLDDRAPSAIRGRGRQGVFQSELDQVRSGSSALSGRPAQRPVADAGRGDIVGYAGLWFVTDEAHVTNVAVRPRPAPAVASRRRCCSGWPMRRSSAGVPRWTLEVRSRRRCPGAVPPLRLQPGGGSSALLREHRGCDRDVVPRHSEATEYRGARSTVDPAPTMTERGAPS
jgi:tRNA threonylcarbamoyladenosine biosynthesis protein TsaB